MMLKSNSWALQMVGIAGAWMKPGGPHASQSGMTKHDNLLAGTCGKSPSLKKFFLAIIGKKQQPYARNLLINRDLGHPVNLLA
jgi:hypothetical protein